MQSRHDADSLADDRRSLPTQPWAKPVHRPPHAIGLNYRDHAAEAGMGLPSEPIVFSKTPNSLSGPAADIVFPADAHRGD